MSSVACKCVFYRPEHSVNGGLHGIEFWRPWNPKWNIPRTTAQRVDEKNGVICLAIMFTLGDLWSLKCQNWYTFCIFYAWQQKTVTVRAKCLIAPERSYWVPQESGRLMGFRVTVREILGIEI